MKINPEKKKLPVFVYYLIMIVVVVIITSIVVPRLTSPNSKQITYNEFIKMLEEGKVEKVELDKSANKITVKHVLLYRHPGRIRRRTRGKACGIGSRLSLARCPAGNDTRLSAVLRPSDPARRSADVYNHANHF